MVYPYTASQGRRMSAPLELALRSPGPPLDHRQFLSHQNGSWRLQPESSEPLNEGQRLEADDLLLNTFGLFSSAPSPDALPFRKTLGISDQRMALLSAKFQNTENPLPCPSYAKGVNLARKFGDCAWMLQILNNLILSGGACSLKQGALCRHFPANRDFNREIGQISGPFL